MNSQTIKDARTTETFRFSKQLSHSGRRRIPHSSTFLYMFVYVCGELFSSNKDISGPGHGEWAVPVVFIFDILIKKIL